MLQDLAGLSGCPDLIFNSVPHFHFGGHGTDVSHGWIDSCFCVDGLYSPGADFVVDAHPIHQS